MLAFWQGGGVFVDERAVEANFDNCEISKNVAANVRILNLNFSRTFLPAPRWSVTDLAFACLHTVLGF